LVAAQRQIAQRKLMRAAFPPRLRADFPSLLPDRRIASQNHAAASGSADADLFSTPIIEAKLPSKKTCLRLSLVGEMHKEFKGWIAAPVVFHPSDTDKGLANPAPRQSDGDLRSLS
jgi:hypothetical protein